MQHYNPDGSLASTWHPWLVDGRQVLPIQEDSTALVLWALWIHYNCARDIEFIGPLYKKLILKSADFLVAYRDPDTHLPLPSFDLWEERYGTHAFTAAAVIAGLRAAADFARLFQDGPRAETYSAAAEQMKDGLARHLYHEGLQRYARSGYRSADGYDLDDVLDVSLLGLPRRWGFFRHVIRGTAPRSTRLASICGLLRPAGVARDTNTTVTSGDRISETTPRATPGSFRLSGWLNARLNAPATSRSFTRRSRISPGALGMHCPPGCWRSKSMPSTDHRCQSPP